MAFVRRKAVFVPDGIELDSVRAGSRVNLIIVNTTQPLRRQQMFPVRKANAGRQHRAQSNEMAPPGLAEKPRTGRVPCAHFAVRNDRSFAAPESSHDHCPWLRRGSPSGRSVKHALAASGGILEHSEGGRHRRRGRQAAAQCAASRQRRLPLQGQRALQRLAGRRRLPARGPPQVATEREARPWGSTRLEPRGPGVRPSAHDFSYVAVPRLAAQGRHRGEISNRPAPHGRRPRSRVHVTADM